MTVATWTRKQAKTNAVTQQECAVVATGVIASSGTRKWARAADHFGRWAASYSYDRRVRALT